jgi:hypothetical protein
MTQTPPERPWFFLPGMGATAAMYNALRHKLDFPVRFINWPAYQGETTYEEVARRIIGEHALQDGDIVGGSSLGGMVALEIGQIIRLKACILLGSAMNSSEVHRLLAKLSPLASITPIGLVQILAGKQANLISSMFSESDTEFIRAMSAYLPRWAGFHEQTERVYRLHGERDPIIPCPQTGATVIEGAGHIIAMTHMNETAAFLRTIKSRLDADGIGRG